MALILAVQPDSASSRAIRDALGTSTDAEIVVVDSITAALTALEAQLPDLILLDVFLAPSDGDRLIARLRTLQGADNVQVIYIPLIQPSPKGAKSFRVRPRRHWLRRLVFNEPQRSGAFRLAWDPQAFAAGAAAYLSRVALAVR